MPDNHLNASTSHETGVNYTMQTSNSTSPENIRKRVASDLSASFISEASISEEELETIGSSRKDFQKKMIYRQKLREFDNQSVGDTSLSSSNISTSPQPRFRFQFDHPSDHFRNSKIRNKVKVASDRLSFRNTIEGEGNSKVIICTSPEETNDSTPLSKNSGESSKFSNHMNYSSVDQVLSDDSQSNVDSIRGISTMTEQSGGENTSSSAVINSDTTHSPQNHFETKESNTSDVSHSNKHLSKGKGSRHYRNFSKDKNVASALEMGESNDTNDIIPGCLFNEVYQPRNMVESARRNPSSWSNVSSSPFVHDSVKWHSRTATWDGSRESTIRSRSTPAMSPYLEKEQHAPESPWLSYYQQPDGMHQFYASQNLAPENDSYGSESFGISESCSSSSSSYTDSCESFSDNSKGTRPPERRKVQFYSEKEATKFDNAMRRVNSVLDKPLFRVQKTDENADDYKKRRMFFCPNCKTEQRDIINFATAAGSFDSPQTYLALYFGLYLVASLFIFGLEEGWRPMDCVYFAVITLTTTGLGDFVPSSDGAKIVCACFIYVGVATIGLLLGSLLVGSLDKAHIKEAQEAQIRDCPNCLRLEKSKLRSSMLNADFDPRLKFDHVGLGLDYEHSDSEDSDSSETDHLDVENDEESNAVKTRSSIPRPSLNLTRHMSIDLRGDTQTLRKCFSEEDVPHTIDESTPFLNVSSQRHPAADFNSGAINQMRVKPINGTHSSSSSETTSSSDSSKPMVTRASAARYVFLTLKQALVNSLTVIAVGSVGYYYIEGMSMVDSFYFTTVLLTSVGYGDIVPVTTQGKLFTTVFSVVAGTVLLQNMSSIAMIPLELRKRRVEVAVLGQFGDHLTDDELRELSTGRLIHRLKLATNRPYGLEECTREMFSLAMLVRLGRITEADVKATFAAFRRLDVGNYGKLNSRTVIEGELMRRRSLRNLAVLASSPHEMGDSIKDSVLYDHQGAEFSLSHYNLPIEIPSSRRQASCHVPAGAFVHHHGKSPDSLIRKPSLDSYYSQDSRVHVPSFEYNEYLRWASSFNCDDGKRSL